MAYILSETLHSVEDKRMRRERGRKISCEDRVEDVEEEVVEEMGGKGGGVWPIPD